MLCPSITATLGCVFLAYISYSMWMLARLFTSLECTSLPCYKYFLESKPKMQLALFTASNSNPISTETRRIYSNASFNFEEKFEKDFVLEIPLKTRLNGSLYMQVVLALEGESLEWKTLRREGPTVIHSLPLTEYVLPQAEAFVLLNTDQAITTSRESRLHKSNVVPKPVSHIMPHVHVVLLTDNISVSPEDVPLEMGRLIRVNQKQQIMPILKTDYFNTRTKDLVKLTRNSTKFNITFHYKPISIGKLRFMLSIEHAMNAFLEMGFTKKDADEFKGMFSDTNVYLLCGTFFVASIHLLFDFLAFKNDVNFWRKKNSYEGLSARTILWRAFSQMVIFAYLIDEGTSMLVLIPSGLGTLIEIWKCKKIFNINFGFDRANGKSESGKRTDIARSQTEEFDKQGMRYLSYLLYPLCFAGSIYSLIYQPHKNWYSWTLSSLVNCVYAFGFLFMLPQLFINYKLKSVAALPWRAFMYKAFNTFIDDIFAFIITMPTAHRVACLRDDVVFIIYLYQRWLYPVDKSRVDTDSVSADIINTTKMTEENKKKEQ